MQSLPSYVKDTIDFILKLKQCKLSSNKTYLVTLDVSSLYTNIPHDDGVEACRHFLENIHYHGYLSIDNLCTLIKVVLHNNFFQFKDDTFLQKMGTAMVALWPPHLRPFSWANLKRTFLTLVILSLMFRLDFWMIFLCCGLIH